ncbi:MAG TPA: thermonuclease family protein [Dehalococcoidia bacterium]|nr:thermonuclease family protein [Dehalococcoidia bacterium]
MARTALLLLLLPLLGACGLAQDLLTTPTPAVQAPREPPPPPAPTLPAGVALPTPPPGLPQAHVTRVVDGDTIEVSMAGRRYTVRYIGVDTPESVAPGQPVECYGREASRRNRELVEGKTVLLEKDVSETDRYGRLLRYVWADGVMVNAVLVAEGYAQVATFPPDVKYVDLFRRLQEQARQQGLGLWGACPAAR